MRRHRGGPDRSRLLVFAVASLALMLGGCLDWVVPGSPAERGYDGAEDPLTRQPADARAAQLQERFDLIQSR